MACTNNIRMCNPLYHIFYGDWVTHVVIVACHCYAYASLFCTSHFHPYLQHFNEKCVPLVPMGLLALLCTYIHVMPLEFIVEYVSLYT